MAYIIIKTIKPTQYIHIQHTKTSEKVKEKKNILFKIDNKQKMKIAKEKKIF